MDHINLTSHASRHKVKDIKGDDKMGLNAKKPIILVGYIPPALGRLAGVPVISYTDGVITASASLSEFGIGEIKCCGFLITDTPAISNIGGFESGTLDGFIPSSTNSTITSNQIAIIDATTTSRADSKYALKICSSGASKYSKVSRSVTGPKVFEFAWKVSSEEGYDNLNWYLDGVLQDSISGEVDWQKKTTNLTPGIHTIEFTYSKDSSGDAGSDCGWIDDVTIETIEPIVCVSQTIPTEIGQEFIAVLTDLPNGVSYIAAFVENGAGRAISEVIAYKKPASWTGGNIHETEPQAISYFIIGDTMIDRTKVDCVYVGKAAI